LEDYFLDAKRDRAELPIVLGCRVMSQGKIIPIIAAGDNAVRDQANDGLDKLRLRVELLEDAAGQLITKADRLSVSVDQLNQRIARLELALSHELAIMQGRIAAVESEISDLASIDAQKEP
jgi:hypothetical protein